MNPSGQHCVVEASLQCVARREEKGGQRCPLFEHLSFHAWFRAQSPKLALRPLAGWDREEGSSEQTQAQNRYLWHCSQEPGEDEKGCRMLGRDEGA